MMYITIIENKIMNIILNKAHGNLKQSNYCEKYKINIINYMFIKFYLFL